MCNKDESLQPLSCPLCCHTSFPTLDSLKLSLLKVASHPLKCPICEEILLGLDKLTIHLFAHSLLNTTAAEKPREDLKVVRKSKAKKKDTSSTKKLTPSAPVVASVSCEVCGIQFQDQSLLTIHLKLVHEAPGPSQETEPKFQCHLCHKVFKMKGSLRIHLRVAHYGFQIKFEPESGGGGGGESEVLNFKPPPNLFAPPESEQKSDNVCEICGKCFTTKYFLKKHKRLHTGD